MYINELKGIIQTEISASPCWANDTRELQVIFCFSGNVFPKVDTFYSAIPSLPCSHSRGTSVIPDGQSNGHRIYGAIEISSAGLCCEVYLFVPAGAIWISRATPSTVPSNW